MNSQPVQKRKWKCVLMSGLGDRASRDGPAWPGGSRFKKGNPQALMMLLLTFRNCIIAFSCQGVAAVEKRNEASRPRLEKVWKSGCTTSQGATYWRWKEKTCYSTRGPSGRKIPKWSDKRAKKKRELRERRKEEAGAINFKAIRSSEAEMFRLMLPGLGRVAHAKREGPSTAKKEPGEKVPAAHNAAKAAGGATRCPNLTRKICSLRRLRTIWKRAKATKRNLSWKRARCSVENVLKLLKQAKGGKQDRATGCYQPFPTLILGCFIWFKIIFLCSISFI